MSKKKIQVFEYEGKRITFDFGDGEQMVNATEMAKAFKGKRIGDFLRLRQTKDFVKALNQKGDDSHIGNKYKALRVVKGGNDRSLQGTWMSDRLALKFAAWLNIEFEIWIYDKILELLKTGSTTLSDDKMIISKKELRFYLQKQKEGTDTFNYFIQSLLNPPDENE